MKTNLLVNIDVPEIERAIAFYTEAFGLTIGRRMGDDFVELLGLSAPLYLLKADAGAAPFQGAATTRSYARHWTPVHLDVVVSEIEEALQKARRAGASVETPTQHKPYGKLVVLADPFGNGFCLIEFTGRGYDEITQQVPAEK